MDLPHILAWVFASGAAVFVRLTGQGTLAGAVAGFVVAALAILGFGPGALLPLATFVFGSGVLTRLGRARKEAAGVAEPNRGRRGVRHVAAKLGLPALVAAAAIPEHRNGALVLAYVAALAGAFADTAGTEAGPLWGGGPVVAWRGRGLTRVTHGATGGISLVGLVASSIAAVAVAVAGWRSGLLPGLTAVAIAAGAGWTASLIESLIGGFRLGCVLGHFGRNLLVSVIATTAGWSAGAMGWGRP
jgi:uncharacterized protein (TIGR00297 family)